MATDSNDVSTFRADSVNEAIVKVKMKLGDNAEIVETREITEGGFLGLFGDTKYEVDAYVPAGASSNGSTGTRQSTSSGQSDNTSREQLREQIEALSRDRNNSTRRSSTQNTASGGSGTSTQTAVASDDGGDEGHEWNVDDPAMPEFSARERAKQLVDDKSDTINGTNGTDTYDRQGVNSQSSNGSSPSNTNSSSASPIDSTKNRQEIDQLVEQTDLIAEKVDSLMDSMNNQDTNSNNGSSPDFPGELDDVYHRLVGQGVEKKFARDLIGRVRRHLEADEFHDREVIEQQVEQEIEEEFVEPSALEVEGDKPLLVPFVGPTGVGKTTTIAKLAAYYSVEESRSVGFITLDGYRLAAVEQLRKYADILRVPLEDVTDTDDVNSAVDNLVEQDVEMIFVDTAGRSQFDDEKISEIEDVFPDEYPVKTHLVVSAKCRTADLKDVLSGFDRIGYDRIAVTKLDETKAHGTVYNLIQRSDEPMAYFTDGQEVPDDLWIAESSLVSEMIVEGDDE